MDWIRFDKRLPPEDTTIMVSNGPAMGTYHYKNELFFSPEHQASVILLWELSGKRVECEVVKIIQWSPVLKSRVKREPIIVKKQSVWTLRVKQRTCCLWKRFKEWVGIC
jgi:hypothetical protein